jgi:hypothetical protein
MRGRLTSQAIARPQATNLGRLGYSSISGMSWMVTSVTARIALRVRSDHISGHRAGGFSNSPFPLFKPEVGIIGRAGLGGLFKLARDIKHVEMALNVIPNDNLHWDEWNNRIGLAIWGATGGSEEGRELFARWSAKSEKNDPVATDARWEGMCKSPPNRAGMGTLWYLAEKHQPGCMTGKPVIKIAAHDIPAAAQFAEELLLNDDHAEIYQRGGALVRPVTEETDASHGRRTKVARLLEVTPIYLRNELDKVAAWMRFDGRKKKEVRSGAPLDIANVILSQEGKWTFPRLAGVITTPTMRPDGSLLVKEGYDEATRLLLMAPPAMPAVPDRPTRNDALAALALLTDLLSEFPFADSVAKAVGLSCLYHSRGARGVPNRAPACRHCLCCRER